MNATEGLNNRNATGSRVQRLAAGVFGALMLTLSGCSGPLWNFPGGALDGPEQAFDPAALDPEGGVIALETNPTDPYSVNVGYVVINGNMYVDPAESRGWYQNMKKDPLIRIRFDGVEAVYMAIAISETNPEVLAQFDADRIVLRLEARQLPK